jgi:signal transduction histidine kinase
VKVYQQKRRWKLILFFAAIIIGSASLYYTSQLMKKLSVEERKRVELWAQATKKLANIDPDQDVSFPFEVLRNNTTIPVILVDTSDNILAHRNLDSLRVSNDPSYLKNMLEKMKEGHEPIIIELYDGNKNIIYYKDSNLLTQLQYYPIIQLGIVFLFILVSYFAFSTSRRAEQNHVWLGMSKETAHQLGTPISSLLAWVEILKESHDNPELIEELQKDVNRLEKITARFSKIGSEPILKKDNLNKILCNSANYIRTRASKKVNFIFDFDTEGECLIPINQELFEWVIENICKNAIDAMEGKGEIIISISDNSKNIIIDISDTGKGIPKSKHKTIFQPGFTTKERGWGLGLSLSKRIIEQYHKGKIFLKSSEINQGSTFRIMLNKELKIRHR